MTLRDVIAADVAAIFMNTDDFAETVTVTPAGGQATFTTDLVIGDSEAQITNTDGMVHEQAQIQAQGAEADVRAKMLISTGRNRILAHGDQIAAGTRAFNVHACRTDGVGGLLIQLIEDDVMANGQVRGGS